MSKDYMEAMLEGISNPRLARQIQESQFPMERWQRCSGRCLRGSAPV
jgi:hypothetical protein